MEVFRRQVEEAAAFIRSRIALRPKIAMILGTGLGGVAGEMENAVAIPYEEIPHFPVSTVAGHEGRLLCGLFAGKPVLAMQGRFHLYEGYTARQISFPIRVLRALGSGILIVSNAAGGLNPQFQAGDLMLVTDHINMTGQNPLVGPNVDEWGARFTDMTEPYSRRLRILAAEKALTARIELHRGVYVGLVGPSLETAAETRFLRAAGADAVGMSLVMEAITAVHAGIELMGVSVITNVNLPDNYQPTPLEEIIATAESAGLRLQKLLAGVVAAL
ncbi:MAG: purine-nucleoside phosphorylase [Desulfobacteraceae bacterium]|nr:purine-nucleoside phosphorylase [Desulfobacteraceae bacterium]